MRIPIKDEIDAKKIQVPLRWFVSSIIFSISCAIPGTYWVFNVNEGIRELKSDMQLVKQKLKITSSYQAANHRDSPGLIEEAKAGQ